MTLFFSSFSMEKVVVLPFVDLKVAKGDNNMCVCLGLGWGGGKIF